MRCPKCLHNSVHKKMTHTEEVKGYRSMLKVVVRKCFCDYCGHEYLDDEAHAEIIQAAMRDIHREKLANYAHEAWSGWMEYMFGKCLVGEVGEVIIPKDLVERWQRQIATPYERLSASEQASDLAEADKMLDIIDKARPR